MIVITGASDGVGLELAKLYKENGEIVVNVSRRSCKYAQHNFLYDLQSEKNIVAAAKDIKKLEGTLKAVINSIGVFTKLSFGKLSAEETNRVINTNATAPMLFISELIGRIKQDEADVLNVVSRAGIEGSGNNPVYATSKWAERGFTLSLQETLKFTPSRVISFCPGGIKTDLFDKADADVNTENWMKPESIALFIKQILELPKNMEVSEVIVNRKRLSK